MPKSARSYREPASPVGTVAELFAGVGGFRIGLARAGLRTVFSNQWEPATKAQHASDVYVARFGSAGHSNVDIAKLDALPNVDLVVGGFPCQDYSVAKSLSAAKGLEGKKGVLWWEILRLVEQARPAYIFLENVDRLLKSPSSQRGRDFAIMLKTLMGAGYVVEWRVVNAAEYGFPQRRIRVFIVATRTDRWTGGEDPATVILKGGVLPRSLAVNPAAEDLLEIALTDSADVLSTDFNRDGSRSPFLNAGFAAVDRAFAAKVTVKPPRTPVNLGDVLVPDSEVPLEYFVSKARLAEWKYLKGAKAIVRQHSGGGTYTYSEGSMAFPDALDRPSRTILTGEGGASPSRFKHIIQTSRGYRRLTPMELERLNGFPDDWTRYTADGKELGDARRAFFMGNALVVGLVEKVGKVLAAEMAS
ncbi:MAG: DNA (cytosine-5-)-methyltransferase [Actinomycetales bacterium]|nr:DNA (cytosine-5-)-methyltransferase [Actinomycetales bacterium]